MNILALSAREVVSVLEQHSNALLSQVFPINMFNKALCYPLRLTVITESWSVNCNSTEGLY